MPEGGPTIQTPISSGFLPFVLSFFLIIPALFTKPALNNAGYIPNVHLGQWFHRVVRLKNKSLIKIMEKTVEAKLFFENLYNLSNTRLSD